MGSRSPVIRGVVPALVTPFTNDYAVDTGALERLVRFMLEVPGIGALFCNGHAGEVAALSAKEQFEVTSVVASVVAGQVPVIAGVYTDSMRDAVDLAKSARKAGADAVTVFPPPSFRDGGMISNDLPVYWHRTIIDAAEIGAVLFQFSRSEGLGYSLETLAELAQLEQVVAVKEGGGTLADYEDTYRLLSSVEPAVPVLTSRNTALLASLAVGADGILSGSGSLLAREQSLLWERVVSGDLHGARAASGRLYELNRAIYKQPSIYMHARIKEAMVAAGMLPVSTVRPPLQPLSEYERESIQRAWRSAVSGSGLH